MNIIRNRKRRIFAAATTAGICASIALAAWLADGVGTGGGKFAELQALTIDAAFSTGDCRPPMNSTCTLRFHVDNPNAQPLRVSHIIRDPAQNASTAGTTNVAACSPGTLNLNQTAVQAPGVLNPLNLVIPASAVNHEVVVPNGFLVSTEPVTECQDAQITKPIQVFASTQTTGP